MDSLNYCHTRAYLSLAEDLKSLSLQDGATTWHYFSKEPSTPQPPDHLDFNSVRPQQPLIGSSSNFKLKLRVPNQNKKCKMHGRQPQIIKSWIFHQPLIGSSTHFKLRLRGPNQNKKSLKWRNFKGKTTSKYQKLNISASTDWTFLKF